ncbi:helix-turn-helix domain-containing protein [Pararhodonellum marinum]|uniref:helix-turn-helix domain-containing protein n=1 Tax=Pararhodonellum marinum TaxID=2755358 RepID=UPI00188EAB5C|nr:helix-turn-helix domain-containing protein [Pararhodonellum marinum]
MITAYNPKNLHLESLVHKIMVIETHDEEIQVELPFFADGFPGILYYEAAQGVYLSGKRLSELMLYGQTISPITLQIKGSYKLIILQLYPLTSKLLLSIDPATLNEDCHDLAGVFEPGTLDVLKKLKSTPDQIQHLETLLEQKLRNTASGPAESIQLALQLIWKSRGQMGMHQLSQRLPFSERTFERQFKSHIGISPKQFAKIIQFNASLLQLSEERFQKLTDVAFDNGFSDHSHFIKTFRRFAGKSPKEFLDQIS